MKLLFADASYWIALLHRRDSTHERALLLSGALNGAALVTTDEVLTEVLAFVSGSGEQARRVAAATIRSILHDTDIQVIPQSRDGFIQGLELYETRLDKGYSLTDCISMNTMRRVEIVRGLRRLDAN